MPFNISVLVSLYKDFDHLNIFKLQKPVLESDGSWHCINSMLTQKFHHNEVWIDGAIPTSQWIKMT